MYHYFNNFSHSFEEAAQIFEYISMFIFNEKCKQKRSVNNETGY